MPRALHGMQSAPAVIWRDPLMGASMERPPWPLFGPSARHWQSMAPPLAPSLMAPSPPFHGVNSPTRPTQGSSTTTISCLKRWFLTFLQGCKCVLRFNYHFGIEL